MLNPKVRDAIFSLMVFTLIFNNIPKPVQMNFIGGVIGNKLILLPLLAGIIYTIYCQYKYKNVLIAKEIFIKYTVIYLGITFLSLLVGLYRYPYYDLVLQGPASQIEKLPVLLNFFNTHGVDISKKELLLIWMLARPIKGLFLEYFYTFGTVYMVFCWYYSDWRNGLKIFFKAVFFSLIAVILYGIIDIFYLLGNKTAKEILININPFIHVIKTAHGWWPPLLWAGQLRSVFSEPSHIGNFLAFALPCLWYFCLKNKKNIYYLILFFFSIIIFFTNARTAILMFIGMNCFLFAFIFLLDKNYFKIFLKIIFISIIGFACTLFLNSDVNQNYHEAQNKNRVKAVDSYVKENVTSIASSNSRSNGARYSLIKSHIRIGLEYPILGVGYGLSSGYVKDNFLESEKKNKEVKMWLNNQKKEGILKYELNAMNEYVTRFSEQGIIGVLIFLFPFSYALFKILRLLRSSDISLRLKQVCISLALIGSLVVSMNGSLNLIFSVWIILGLAFAIIFDRNLSNE